MIRMLLATAVVFTVFLGVIPSASAHSLTAQKLEAKKTYYHSVGYIHAIWKNAKTTVYHPNMKKRAKWKAALTFLEHRRDRAREVLHPKPRFPEFLLNAFSCIHRYEGAWNSNTGNGYYGGLQMDSRFQMLYGADFARQWGTADNWPIWAQIQAATRAYYSGRGFGPWPNTARACGLL